MACLHECLSNAFARSADPTWPGHSVTSQQAMSSDNLNNDVANMTVSDDSEGGAGPSIVPTSQKATWGSYIKQVRSFLVGMA